MYWYRAALGRLPESQGGRRRRAFSVMLIGLHEPFILLPVGRGEPSLVWQNL